MKPYLIFAAIAVSLYAAPQFDVPDTKAGKIFAGHASDSDRVLFTVVEKDTKPIQVTVTDRVWIAEFARILAEAVYVPQEHIFAMSPPISFLDKDGKKTLGIEILPGRVLRVEDRDYRVGAKTIAALVELLKKKG